MPIFSIARSSHPASQRHRKHHHRHCYSPLTQESGMRPPFAGPAATHSAANAAQGRLQAPACHPPTHTNNHQPVGRNVNDKERRRVLVRGVQRQAKAHARLAHQHDVAPRRRHGAPGPRAAGTSCVWARRFDAGRKDHQKIASAFFFFLFCFTASSLSTFSIIQQNK